MFSYIFGLIVLFGWATGDIFGGLASRKIGAPQTSFLVSIFGMVLFLPGFILESAKLTNLSLGLLLLTIVLSLFWMAGNVILNHGLKVGYPSVVATVGMSFTALVVILNSIFFNNYVGPMQWSAIGVIMVGIFVTGISVQKDELERKKLLKSIRLGIACMICWAAFFTFIKIVSDKVGWFIPLYIAIIVSAVFLWIGFKISKQNFSFKTVPLYVFGCTLASALILRASDLILNWSIQNNTVDVVGPIAGASPTLFALLSFFIFKERLKKIQLMGVIVTLVGIVMLAFVS